MGKPTACKPATPTSLCAVDNLGADPALYSSMQFPYDYDSGMSSRHLAIGVGPGKSATYSAIRGAGWAGGYRLVSFPDPPRKAERGSGVLSDNSCHMGRGRTS